VMHFLWTLLFKWFAFSPNLLHLISSSVHIKLRTWLGFNSILDFVCAVKMSWISPINASFSLWALDLVIGLLEICKASFELFICAGAWGWLNFRSWFSSVSEWIGFCLLCLAQWDLLKRYCRRFKEILF